MSSSAPIGVRTSVSVPPLPNSVKPSSPQAFGVSLLRICNQPGKLEAGLLTNGASLERISCSYVKPDYETRILTRQL